MVEYGRIRNCRSIESPDIFWRNCEAYICYAQMYQSVTSCWNHSNEVFGWSDPKGPLLKKWSRRRSNIRILIWYTVNCKIHDEQKALGSFIAEVCQVYSRNTSVWWASALRIEDANEGNIRQHGLHRSGNRVATKHLQTLSLETSPGTLWQRWYSHFAQGAFNHKPYLSPSPSRRFS
jgi:hypothetical protein